MAGAGWKCLEIASPPPRGKEGSQGRSNWPPRNFWSPPEKLAAVRAARLRSSAQSRAGLYTRGRGLSRRGRGLLRRGRGLGFSAGRGVPWQDRVN